MAVPPRPPINPQLGDPFQLYDTQIPTDVAPPPDRPTHGGYMDSYNLGFMRSIRDWSDRADAGMDKPAPIGWKPSIPTGYGEYGEAFLDARTPEELNVIKTQVDRNLDAYHRRAQRGILPSLGWDLLAGITSDPTALVGSEVKGATFLGRAAIGALEQTGITAGTEVIRQNLSPTASLEESAYAITGAGVIGGVVGGTFGRRAKALEVPRERRAPITPAARAPEPLASPLSGPRRVTSPMGTRPAPRTKGGLGSTQHEGVDLAAREGEPIRAEADGVVTEAKVNGGFGNWVRIKYGDGSIEGGYGHLSRWAVEAGDTVRKGDIIGYVGSTGKSTGPHLHQQRWVNGVLVDPLAPVSTTSIARTAVAEAPTTPPDVLGTGLLKELEQAAADFKGTVQGPAAKPAATLAAAPDARIQAVGASTNRTEWLDGVRNLGSSLNDGARIYDPDSEGTWTIRKGRTVNGTDFIRFETEGGETSFGFERRAGETQWRTHGQPYLSPQSKIIEQTAAEPAIKTVDVPPSAGRSVADIEADIEALPRDASRFTLGEKTPDQQRWSALHDELRAAKAGEQAPIAAAPDVHPFDPDTVPPHPGYVYSALGGVEVPTMGTFGDRGVRIGIVTGNGPTARYTGLRPAEEIATDIADEMHVAAQPLEPEPIIGHQLTDANSRMDRVFDPATGTMQSRRIPQPEGEGGGLGYAATPQRTTLAPGDAPRREPDPTYELPDSAKDMNPDQLFRYAEELEAQVDDLREQYRKGVRELPYKSEANRTRAKPTGPPGEKVQGRKLTRKIEDVARYLTGMAKAARDQANWLDGEWVEDPQIGPHPDYQIWRPAERPAHDDIEVDPVLAEMNRLEAERRASVESGEVVAPVKGFKKAKGGPVRHIDPSEYKGDLAWKVDKSPYGAGWMHSDSNPFMEGIDLNIDQITRDFTDKAWTRPQMEGVDAMADDAFKDVADYAQWVYLHELYHSTVPKLAKQTDAEYENYINKLATDHLAAEKVTWKPSANRLQHLAIAPSPLGQMERMLKEWPQLKIFKSIMDLSGDGALFTARNRMGAPTTPGGSVYQRSQMWLRHQYEINRALDQGYADAVGRSVTGLDPTSALGMKIGTAVKQKLARGYTPLQFSEDVMAHIAGLTDRDYSEAAIKASAEITKVYERFAQTAKDMGLSPGPATLIKKAKKQEAKVVELDARIQEVKDRGGRQSHLDVLNEMRERARQRAEDFRQQADSPEAQLPLMPKGEEKYVPKHYDQSALEDKEALALHLLEGAYAREGSNDPGASAKAAYDLLTREPTGELGHMGSPMYMKMRKIPWTTEEAFPFLVKDLKTISSIYIRRMSSQIEMARRFGDGFGLDHLDELEADMIEAGVPEKTRVDALQIWQDQRDHINGQFHGRDPLSMRNRGVRALKNYGSLTFHGKLIKSQMMDVARINMVHGFGTRFWLGSKEAPAGLVQGIWGLMRGHFPRGMDSLAKHGGEAMEYVQAAMNARMIESDSALLVTRQTWLEKALAKAQYPYFLANFMIPFTVAAKEVASYLSGHNIVQDSKLIASAVRAGEEPNLKAIQRMARVGIDKIDAMIIADMPTEQTPGGLHLVNIDDWDAHGPQGKRAAEVMRGAVNGEIRRAVVTPGPLDAPAIVSGVIHSRAGAREARKLVGEAEDLVLKRKAEMGEVWQLDEKHPDRIEALDNLQQAYGQLEMARRNVGAAGRIEAPELSLPFQIKSFMFASGGKLLHGLVSTPERNRVMGMLGMMGTSMAVTYWKANGYIDDWKEFMVNSLDQMGVGGWLEDFGKNVDALVNLGVFHDFDEKGQYYADEAGAVLGPSIGSLFKTVEASLNNDIPPEDTRRQLLGAIPGYSLIWLQYILGGMKEGLKSAGVMAPGTGSSSADHAPIKLQPVVPPDEMLGKWGVTGDDPRFEKFKPLPRTQVIPAFDSPNPPAPYARDVAKAKRARRQEVLKRRLAARGGYSGSMRSDGAPYDPAYEADPEAYDPSVH